jgi:hypothetical protein
MNLICSELHDFVFPRTMQTGKEPVKVSLRLTPLDL